MLTAVLPRCESGSRERASFAVRGDKSGLMTANFQPRHTQTLSTAIIANPASSAASCAPRAALVECSSRGMTSHR